MFSGRIWKGKHIDKNVERTTGGNHGEWSLVPVWESVNGYGNFISYLLTLSFHCFDPLLKHTAKVMIEDMGKND